MGPSRPHTRQGNAETDVDDSPRASAGGRFHDPFPDRTDDEPVDAPSAWPPSGAWPKSSHSCVLLGPSAAGKTSFLLAAGRTLQLPERGGPEVGMIPVGPATMALGGAVRSITLRQPLAQPTVVPWRCTFDLQWRVGSNGYRPPAAAQSVAFTFVDGPGSALFGMNVGGTWPLDTAGRPGHAELLDEARRADSVALFFDAMEPGTDRWLTTLPRLIAELAAVTNGGGRALPFARVLVVVARFDTLCEDALDTLCATQGHPRHGLESGVAEDYSIVARLAGYRPGDLALAFDPLRQARELVGEAVLETLRQMLAPRAQLAVVLTSSGGFDAASGEPFLDLAGWPRADTGQSGEELLRRWRPFGVREALLFLAFGVVGFPLATVSRGALLS